MADKIQTQQVSCQGGLIASMDYLQQATEAPGSAMRLVNYEPMIDGGYRRIDGYAKFSLSAVPGTGPIRGVAMLGQWVIACRGSDIYRSSGLTWTKLNGSTTYPGNSYFRFASYNFGTQKLVGVDGANPPFSVDGAGNFVVLTAAPAGADCVTEYKNRLWFSVGSVVTFSAPMTDNDFTPANGAGQINAGGLVMSMRGWRDQLVIFELDRIQRITGSTSAEFQMKPITTALGCVQRDSVAEVGGNLVFLAHDGLRTVAGTDHTDGFNLDNIARPIQPLITGLRQNLPRVVAVVVRNKQQLRLYGTSPTAPADLCTGYIGTQRTTEGNFEWGELKGIKAQVVYSGVNEGGDEKVVFGSDTGYVYLLDQGSSFDGAPIEAAYQTPHLAFGDIGIRKVFRRLRVVLKTETSYNLTVRLLLDMAQIGVPQPTPDQIAREQAGLSLFGVAVFGAATFGGTATPVEPLQLVGTGFTGSLLFTSRDTLASHSLHGLAIDITPEGRK